MSPEALTSQFSRPSMDVWAMGITLVELFHPSDSGEVLEGLKSSCKAMNGKSVVHHAQASKNEDVQIQALLCGMLDPSPETRTTAQQALQLIREIKQRKN